MGGLTTDERAINDSPAVREDESVVRLAEP